MLENILGLKEVGISKHTIAYLMEPPRKQTIAASRYKGYVKARVPGYRNQYREDNIDQHYLFACVSYRSEFAQMFSKFCAIFSCDDMNKVKVGALAVSRYHQTERFFPIEDAPNVPDHDFPVPGYLLIPSGYMRLVPNTDTCTDGDSDSLEGNVSELYTEASNNDFTDSTVQDEHNSTECDVSIHMYDSASKDPTCTEASPGSATVSVGPVWAETSSGSVTASVGPVCAEVSSGTVTASVGPVCAEASSGTVTASVGPM